ncbi:MAG: serine/threonine-protein kinase [Granulosicoccus sp.]
MVDDRTALMSARALDPGYEILWYTIDRVLGQGGFGITYLAHDRNLDRAVAIKEYLPTTFAYRQENYSVKPITGDHSENFVWGLGSFLKEAQTLARFSHPNVVRVHSVFEENNTAYMVMEYEHGENLATIYKQQQNLDQQFFEQIFFPIFDGLKEIHKFEFIHRDIKPANIYIRNDGTPVLIDFGSARQTTQQQTGEMTTLVSQGYTPLEQYSANYGDQGPWTDIYALAATVYEGIVGKKPDESLSRSACFMRSKPDLLEQLDSRVFTGFNQRFLDAVFAGLKLEPEGRPQSLEAWSGIFANGVDEPTVVSAHAASGFTELEDDRTRIQPKRRAPKALDSDLDFDNFDDLNQSNKSGALSDRTVLQQPKRDEPRQAPVERSRAAEPARPHSLGGFDERPKKPEFDTQADLLSFSDDDLETDSRIRGGNKSKKTSDIKPAKRKTTGLIAASVVVVALLGAGGAFYLYKGNDEPSILLGALGQLAKPPQSVATQLPAEGALLQLDKMAQLAPLLDRAHAINPADPTLIANVRSTEASLLTLAKQWNGSRHEKIAAKIRQVSQALPAALHDKNRIQAILSASDQISARAQILALLDDKRYLTPAGDSVLDKITTVNSTEFEALKTSTQWNQMMSEFKTAAMEKLAQSDFNGAAKLTEVALTMDANDAEFNALRSFLAKQ